MENHNWYAVITARVLMSKELSHAEKLLMAVVSNLSNEKGYCYASNAYIGDCLGLSNKSVSRYINGLKSKGYLGVIIYKQESQQIEARWLTIIEHPIDPLSPELSTPPVTLSPNLSIPPIPKTGEVNNIIYKNKEKEIYKEKISNEEEFKNEVFEFIGKQFENRNPISPDTAKAFFVYWSEKDTRGKMRWQKEETWELKKRIYKWIDNELKFNNNGKK